MTTRAKLRRYGSAVHYIGDVPDHDEGTSGTTYCGRTLSDRPLYTTRWEGVNCQRCLNRKKRNEAKPVTILAKVGTHALASVRVLSPLPFFVIPGDRCVIEYENRKVPCIIDKKQGGTPNGRPIYFLSRR